jgi:hypothetical protein
MGDDLPRLCLALCVCPSDGQLCPNVACCVINITAQHGTGFIHTATCEQTDSEQSPIAIGGERIKQQLRLIDR